MDPVSILTIIDLSAKVLLACYRLQSQIKDAKSDITQLIDELESVSTVLTELHAIVTADTIPSLGTISVANVESGPLAAVRHVLDDLQRKLQPFSKPGLKAKLLWPLESKSIKEKVAVLQNAKSTLQLAISSLQTAMLGNQTEKLNFLEEETSQAQRLGILKWFKVCDPEVNHRLSCEQREPRTSAWLMENASFKDWIDSSGSMLWLHGIPGAGKTILCSSIIEHLNDTLVDAVDSSVLYFYFDFADTGKQTVANFVKSLIYQLLSTSNGGSIDPASQLHKKCNAGAEEPQLDELVEVFWEILPAKKTVYICIDALDECLRTDRDKVFQFLETCATVDNLSVCITSRREVDIEDGFKKTSPTVIPIERSAVDADVRTWVENAISRHSTLSKWRPSIRQEMLEAIVQGSNGM
jgi:hypothetical protein